MVNAPCGHGSAASSLTLRYDRVMARTLLRLPPPTGALLVLDEDLALGVHFRGPPQTCVQPENTADLLDRRDDRAHSARQDRRVPGQVRLSLSFRLRRHVHQGVPLKHRAIEVPAAVVVLHAADRGGDATCGKGGHDSAQRQRRPGGGRRRSGTRCGGLLLGQRRPAAGPRRPAAGRRRPAAWRRRPAAGPRPSAAGPAAIWAASAAWTEAPTMTAHVRRRTPRIACASGTSCTGRSGTSAMSIKPRVAATTAILSIVFMSFLLSVSAGGAAAVQGHERRSAWSPGAARRRTGHRPRPEPRSSRS